MNLNYLLVCVECDKLCRPEAVGQESREAEQQAEEVQTHQSDNLFMMEAKSSNAADDVSNKVTRYFTKYLPLTY